MGMLLAEEKTRLNTGWDIVNSNDGVNLGEIEIFECRDKERVRSECFGVYVCVFNENFRRL